jgi:hypothetical protein
MKPINKDAMKLWAVYQVLKTVEDASGKKTWSTTLHSRTLQNLFGKKYGNILNENRFDRSKGYQPGVTSKKITYDKTIWNDKNYSLLTIAEQAMVEEYKVFIDKLESKVYGGRDGAKSQKEEVVKVKSPIKTKPKVIVSEPIEEEPEEEIEPEYTIGKWDEGDWYDPLSDFQ